MLRKDPIFERIIHNSGILQGIYFGPTWRALPTNSDIHQKQAALAQDQKIALEQLQKFAKLPNTKLANHAKAEVLIQYGAEKIEELQSLANVCDRAKVILATYYIFSEPALAESMFRVFLSQRDENTTDPQELYNFIFAKCHLAFVLARSEDKTKEEEACELFESLNTVDDNDLFGPNFIMYLHDAYNPLLAKMIKRPDGELYYLRLLSNYEKLADKYNHPPAQIELTKAYLGISNDGRHHNITGDILKCLMWLPNLLNSVFNQQGEVSYLLNLCLQGQLKELQFTRPEDNQALTKHIQQEKECEQEIREQLLLALQLGWPEAYTHALTILKNDFRKGFEIINSSAKNNPWAKLFLFLLHYNIKLQNPGINNDEPLVSNLAKARMNGCAIANLLLIHFMLNDDKGLFTISQEKKGANKSKLKDTIQQFAHDIQKANHFPLLEDYAGIQTQLGNYLAYFTGILCNKKNATSKNIGESFEGVLKLSKLALQMNEAIVSTLKNDSNSILALLNLPAAQNPSLDWLEKEAKTSKKKVKKPKKKVAEAHLEEPAVLTDSATSVVTVENSNSQDDGLVVAAAEGASAQVTNLEPPNTEELPVSENLGIVAPFSFDEFYERVKNGLEQVGLDITQLPTMPIGSELPAEQSCQAITEAPQEIGIPQISTPSTDASDLSFSSGSVSEIYNYNGNSPSYALLPYLPPNFISVDQWEEFSPLLPIFGIGLVQRNAAQSLLYMMCFPPLLEIMAAQLAFEINLANLAWVYFNLRKTDAIAGLEPLSVAFIYGFLAATRAELYGFMVGTRAEKQKFYADLISLPIIPESVKTQLEAKDFFLIKKIVKKRMKFQHNFYKSSDMEFSNFFLYYLSQKQVLSSPGYFGGIGFFGGEVAGPQDGITSEMNKPAL